MANYREVPEGSNRYVGQWQDPDGTRRSRRLDGIFTVKAAKTWKRETETRLAQGLFGDPKDQPVPPSAGLVTGSLSSWSYVLKNRAAVSDGQQVRKWLVPCPVLAGVTLAQFDLGIVRAFVGWLETVDQLGPGSRRRMFTFLSRWASQATWDGLLKSNPCRDLPRSRRPPPKVEDKASRPWVRTEEELAKLMAALPRPLALALWLGNRSGLRLGETFGLRLGDLEELDKGWIRVARSFGGPIKESKNGQRGVKWVPATHDAPAVLGPLIFSRKLFGAGDEDLLFVPPDPGKRIRPWKGWLPHTVEAYWRKVQKATGFAGTWKDASRHSFASRHISNGESLEAVSRALGHASTKITRDSYEHVLKTAHPEGLRTAGERPPEIVPDAVKKLFGMGDKDP